MNISVFSYIGWAAFRYNFRDRVAAFFILFLPFAVIILVGAILSPDNGRPVGIVINDTGPWAQEAWKLLQRDAVIRPQLYSGAAQLSTAVRREQITAGVIIPAGFDNALSRGTKVTVPFVIDSEATVPAAVRLAVNRDITGLAAIARATYYAATLRHLSSQAALRKAEAAAEASVPSVRVEATGGATVAAATGTGYTAPGNLVLFVLLNVAASGSGLVTARQLGIAQRSFSSSNPAWLLGAAEMFGRFLLGITQAAIIVGAGALLFHIRWGAPLLVALVVGLIALIGSALALIVAAVAKTAQQTMILAASAVLLTGMIGGCMWPVAIENSTLQAIARAFPPAWAVNALLSLGAANSGPGGVARDIEVLAAFALGLAVVSLPLYIRRSRAAQ